MTLPNTIAHVADQIAEVAWNGIVGMAISNENGVIQAANPHFCNLLQYTEREIVGKHFREITSPADQAVDEVEFNLLLAGQIDHYQLAKTWIGKRQQMIAGNLFVQRMNDGEIVFAIAQVVESQSPEQVAGINVMFRQMMDELLESQGLEVVPQREKKPWHKDMNFLVAVGTVWPVIAFVGWVVFKLAKLIDP